ncbi:MAG: hypothetical protein DMG96_27020 [Acidobacteria bacterium]|nr:MAG: hypothetical protein DMG96_27020 [Acidobacteriota bacterium]
MFRQRDGPTIVTSEQPRQERQLALRSVGSFKRRSLIAAFVAASTLGSGIVNLISVIGGISQPKILVAAFPLEFSRLSRTLTLLIGFALIAWSVNIYKRKKRAWAVVIALSSFSAIFHLTQDLNFEKAVLSSALLLLLLFARSTFTVRSRNPDLRSSLLCLFISAAVAMGYGVTGFWLLDARHFGVNFHIEDAVVATLRFLSLSGDPRLVPQTQYGHWFLDSLYVITLTAGMYSGFSLFRPIVYRFRIAPRERAGVGEILKQYARTPLDVFKLWPDKSYFFALSPRSVIAYRVAKTESGAGENRLQSDRLGTVTRSLNSRHREVACSKLPGGVLGKLRRSLHSPHLTRVPHRSLMSTPLEIYDDMQSAPNFQLKTDDNLFTFRGQFPGVRDIQRAA